MKSHGRDKEAIRQNSNNKMGELKGSGTDCDTLQNREGKSR